MRAERRAVLHARAHVLPHGHKRRVLATAASQVRGAALSPSVRHSVLASATAPELYAGSSGPEPEAQPASQGKAARSQAQLLSAANAAGAHTSPASAHALVHDTRCAPRTRCHVSTRVERTRRARSAGSRLFRGDCDDALRQRLQRRRRGGAWEGGVPEAVVRVAHILVLVHLRGPAQAAQAGWVRRGLALARAGATRARARVVGAARTVLFGLVRHLPRQ